MRVFSGFGDGNGAADLSGCYMRVCHREKHVRILLKYFMEQRLRRQKS